MKIFKFVGSVVGKRPIIPVFFEVRAYKKSKMVDFLVDTGSIFSALSEKEATIMGIDCSDLPEAKGEAIGFGGLFKTKMINRLATLTFRSSNRQEYKINYDSGFRVICVPSNATREEREKILRSTPSVLGMDILLAKFKIYVDGQKVELTSNE